MDLAFLSPFRALSGALTGSRSGPALGALSRRSEVIHHALEMWKQTTGGGFFSADPATIPQVYRDLAAFF